MVALPKIPILLLSLRSTSSIAYDLMDRPTLKVRQGVGVHPPTIIVLHVFTRAFLSLHILQYGTAWKKDRTADLVAKAIKAGFRHIDTACQPRHYNER
jgi:hypothetical protein